MKFRIEGLRTLPPLIKELANGLRNLSFADNFQSFEFTGTIAANTEEKIRNQLTFIPSGYIMKKQTGNALVTAGSTEWDENFIYIMNHDASNSATITITFLR